ncbi:hypothetical protein GGI1_23296, partial [Acidithiobacillus sp. GGI-221]
MACARRSPFSLAMVASSVVMDGALWAVSVNSSRAFRPSTSVSIWKVGDMASIVGLGRR